MRSNGRTNRIILGRIFVSVIATLGEKTFQALYIHSASSRIEVPSFHTPALINSGSNPKIHPTSNSVWQRQHLVSEVLNNLDKSYFNNLTLALTPPSSRLLEPLQILNSSVMDLATPTLHVGLQHPTQEPPSTRSFGEGSAKPSTKCWCLKSWLSLSFIFKYTGYKEKKPKGIIQRSIFPVSYRAIFCYIPDLHLVKI